MSGLRRVSLWLVPPVAILDLLGLLSSQNSLPSGHPCWEPFTWLVVFKKRAALSNLITSFSPTVVFLKLCNQRSSQFLYSVLGCFGEGKVSSFATDLFYVQNGSITPAKCYKTEATVTRCLLPRKWIGKIKCDLLQLLQPVFVSPSFLPFLSVLGPWRTLLVLWMCLTGSRAGQTYVVMLSMCVLAKHIH